VSAGQKATRARAALFTVGFGTALSLMGSTTLYTVLPTHTADAGVALGMVGVLFSANRAVRVLLNGPLGWVYDRWPRRRLFVPLLFVGALSTALCAMARGFWPLLAARVLWGAAWSAIAVGGQAIILDVTTVQDRGRWTGWYWTTPFLGWALATFAGGLLVDRFGYRAALWIGAIVGVVGSLPALLWLPETSSLRPTPAGAQAAPSAGLGAGSPAPHATYKAIASAPWYRDRGLWVLNGLQAINYFVTTGVAASTLALVVKERLTIIAPWVGVATLTGALGAARTLLSMGSAPAAGTLSDRLGKRELMIVGSMGLGAAGMLLLASRTPWVVLWGVGLGALSDGGLRGLITAQGGDLARREQRGQVMGMLSISGDVGNTLGPVVAYALLPWVGLSGVYLLCAALLALGSLSAPWLNRRGSVQSGEAARGPWS
jgi:DHA1 family multidrug resistance protein-like MFS transporter